MMHGRLLSFALLVLASTMPGCRTTGASTGRDESRRLAPPLPAGRAEAFFALDTGGDQMGSSAKPARLMLVLRAGDTEQRKAIATCREAGLGTALGGGTETHLEVAACDGEYWLETDRGAVVVRRITGDSGTEVARLRLPAGVERAVRP